MRRNETSNPFKIAYANTMTQEEILEYRKEVEWRRKKELKDKIFNIFANALLIVSILYFLLSVAAPVAQGLWNGRNMEFPISRIVIDEETGEPIEIK